VRLAGRLKLGYYPLPPDEGDKIRNLLHFGPEPASVIDPCVGTGAALQQITKGGNCRLSEVNVVRQPFSQVDIRSNKAMCLVGRINMFWGFGWKAIPHAFGEGAAAAPECDLLISCVDTRKARHQIAQSFTKFRAPAYHLDLGNNASSGQYVLGQPRDRAVSARAQETRLPTVFELYPEIADITIKESELPSCSAVEALDRQEPFINQALAVSSLAMLARLLRYGQISYHGGFYNAETGRMAPLIADPEQFAETRRRAAKKQRSQGATRGRRTAS
jgi:PRTRC genetic system ThiF family protein